LTPNKFPDGRPGSCGRNKNKFGFFKKMYYLCGTIRQVNKMKTLIIHPKDRSTQFLDIVYKNIPNKTIITGGVTKEELKKLIEEHDRVMMCGHGAPVGLFSVGQFPNSGGLIIDHTMIDILSKKDNSIFIWCNADQFVNRYQLKGFYSGMFISEVGEAYYCGLPGTKQGVVDESNFGFCELLSECINEPQEVMYDTIIEKYGKIAEENPVALYNHNRLYLSK
jgi:hypothetical protein